MSASFRWHPNGKPPPILPHSKAKLEVLRRYLQAYFDRLNTNRSREEFKLDLIDGFAGGGTFRDGNTLISGSPLIMLEETKKAEEQLNQNRPKPLHIDCKFYFVEKEKAHTDHLQKTLKERGYSVDGEHIVVRNGLFEDEIEGILNSIRQRQPRAGRSIFLLDQTGFMHVKWNLISRIFEELAAAEVILTFAVDALIRFRKEKQNIDYLKRELQISDSKINELIQSENERGSKALIQRALREPIRARSGANFDTPFFICPAQSRRALWFLHLSRHPTARNVMMQQHWEIYNTFEHYGSGGLDMLGTDALKDPDASLFRFMNHDKLQMVEELLDSLPKELFILASAQPLTVDAFRYSISNRTAATFEHLNQVLVELYKAGEVEILGANGKPKSKSRSLRHLKPTDLITLPSTLFFPGFSRRGRN